MALEHPRLLAASLSAALLAASCSTPSESTTGPTPDPDAGGAPMPVEPMAQDPAPQDPAQRDPAAQDPQGPPMTLDQQRRAALVQRYLELAESLRLEGRLDAALHELLKARTLQPENERVRQLITAVQAERGVPVGQAIDFHGEQARLRELAEERARADVTDRLQRAREEMAASNFAAAVDLLRQAQLTIRFQDQMDWRDLPQQVANVLADAEAQLAAQQTDRQAEANERLAALLREQREEMMARRRADVDRLLRQSQSAFEARNFRLAQELAQKAHEIDPSNGLALDLAHTAAKAARDQSNNLYYHQKAREIRQLLETQQELKTPYTRVLSIDDSTWERAQQRAQRLERATAMDPQDEALLEQVRMAPVGRQSYTEESGGYLDVIRNLQLVVPEIPLIVTPQAREVIESEGLTMVIELVNSISLANFLDQMVQRSTNLAWTVRDGVVLIGDKSEASGTIVAQVHPVKDLVFRRTQFLPPRIRDIPGGDVGFDETPRTGGEGDEKISFIDIADLVQNLKDATDPAYWDSGDTVEITPEETGYLVVKASPEMHRRIQGVLDDMRRFSTPVVTIDSKFLTISRNFLQEVGVDFRGLGGSGNKGTTVSLDDVTNGLQNNASRGLDNGGTGDPAANPLAGAFFNDGQDGDIRARSENFFLSDLGRALSPNGGLTAGWTLIDDTQLQMLLRAIEKQEEAEVVNSQILSVMDRERGHVAVINQTAYVRDFDVEVAQASFIADPKVDVIQDGIVLDVQPVIMMDRKYIVLNLNPTVAELTRPIPTFTTSLAGSTLPVTLQLPNLTVTSFATTARVPDGGTVLLGGLRQVLSKERRAEVPLLANLPLISFFFKQEGVVDENRSLMVMVRAWITDVRDALR